MTEVITGKVKYLNLERKSFTDYYSGPTTENYNVYLNIGLDVKNSMIYFDTPKTHYSISCAPGVAVCCVKESNWIGKIEAKAANGSSGNVCGDAPISNILKGDTITIRGREKYSKVSKAGNRYRVFNYVKLISIDKHCEHINGMEDFKKCYCGSILSKKCPICDTVEELNEVHKCFGNIETVQPVERLRIFTSSENDKPTINIPVSEFDKAELDGDITAFLVDGYIVELFVCDKWIRLER